MTTKNAIKKSVSYSSTGVVLGNFWGGGSGAYAARELSATKLKDLIQQAKDGIADGSLDAGMGFESLTAAVLVITKTTTITIDGKRFSNKEFKLKVLGKMSQRTREWLIQTYFSM